MKANFILIGLCIILLSTIYFINNQQNHWTQFIPLGYDVFFLILVANKKHLKHLKFK